MSLDEGTGTLADIAKATALAMVVLTAIPIASDVEWPQSSWHPTIEYRPHCSSVLCGRFIFEETLQAWGAYNDDADHLYAPQSTLDMLPHIRQGEYPPDYLPPGEINHPKLALVALGAASAVPGILAYIGLPYVLPAMTTMALLQWGGAAVAAGVHYAGAEHVKMGTVAAYDSMAIQVDRIDTKRIAENAYLDAVDYVGQNRLYRVTNLCNRILRSERGCSYASHTLTVYNYIERLRIAEESYIKFKLARSHGVDPAIGFVHDFMSIHLFDTRQQLEVLHSLAELTRSSNLGYIVYLSINMLGTTIKRLAMSELATLSLSPVEVIGSLGSFSLLIYSSINMICASASALTLLLLRLVQTVASLANSADAVHYACFVSRKITETSKKRKFEHLIGVALGFAVSCILNADYFSTRNETVIWLILFGLVIRAANPLRKLTTMANESIQARNQKVVDGYQATFPGVLYK